MRKTISLRLTEQEEEIISSMRKKGLSPSTLLRQAISQCVQENDASNMEKEYKDVNHVNHFHQEKKKIDDKKGYKYVNHVNQKIDHSDDFLGEKIENETVNHAKQSHDNFFNQYLYEIHRHIQQLEAELNDWKMRYDTETRYWKETYQSLQEVHHNHVNDSTKRIDEKFDRIMFYIEESRKTPLHTFELSSDVSGEKQKKKWSGQSARM